MINLNLKTSKEQALREYKEAKANLMATFNGKNLMMRCLEFSQMLKKIVCY